MGFSSEVVGKIHGNQLPTPSVIGDNAICCIDRIIEGLLQGLE